MKFVSAITHNNRKMKSQLISTSIIIAIIPIVIFSCNSSNNSQIKKEQETNKLTMFHRKWIQMRSNCNKLVVMQYYLDPNSNTTGCKACETWVDSTSNVKIISDFNQLFMYEEDGGYCCCPYQHYSITFFRDSTKLGTYYVDTVTKTGKTTFFDISYQTSFFIAEKDWNTFLRSFTDQPIGRLD